MKKLVLEVVAEAKAEKKDFEIVVNNGEELLTEGGGSSSRIDEHYVGSISGFLIESLNYGLGGVDKSTPDGQRSFMLSYIGPARDRGLPILVIDYCADPENQLNSFHINRKNSYLLRIINAGFDGAVLDGVDVFQFFESQR
ncbi:MAG: hypothetical protein CMN78_00260 [Spirochaetales bacterium]|nr:hypothetical protein [Spirochaetales bacterium]